jgi:inosine-uridine nucleoside N-ribohydrolase
VPDVDVMVAACNPKGRRGLVYPHGFPEAADAALTDDAGEAIVRLVRRHGGALRVVVVGPLTPLAEALAVDKDNVMRTLGGLYLQVRSRVS